MPLDLNLSDPTLTPAERERRRELVAEHRRQVAREEEQKRLDDKLRRVFLDANPNATEGDVTRALPGLRETYHEERMKERIQKLAAEDDSDDLERYTDPSRWGLGRT